MAAGLYFWMQGHFISPHWPNYTHPILASTGKHSFIQLASLPNATSLDVKSERLVWRPGTTGWPKRERQSWDRRVGGVGGSPLSYWCLGLGGTKTEMVMLLNNCSSWLISTVRSAGIAIVNHMEQSHDISLYNCTNFQWKFWSQL